MQYYVRAGSLHGFVELVEELGGDAFSLLSSAMILPGHVHDPDNLILYEHLGALLELSSDELNMPDFGIELGLRQGIVAIGIIGAYMSQQATLEKSLVIANKFTYMHAQGANLELSIDSDNTCCISLDMLINNTGQFPQLAYLSICLVYRMIEDMLARQWRGSFLTFRLLPPPEIQKRIQQKYKCRIVFGAEKDAIFFDKQYLQKKPKQPDDLINNIINKQFQINQGDKKLNLLEVVSHAISMLLPTGDCSKENVAQSLGMHPKTLERRLKSKGKSYHAMLEDARINLTLRTLKLNNMTLTSLALSLGYSEYSAFSRSFKRWFGVSVKNFMAQKQSSAQGQ